MTSISLLLYVSSLLVLARSQNICSPELPADSQLCSLRTDSCANVLVRSVCQRYCGICVDIDGTETVPPITFTNSGIDSSCQDLSKFCDKFVNQCQFEKIKDQCRRTCGLCDGSSQPPKPTRTTPSTTTNRLTNPSKHAESSSPVTPTAEVTAGASSTVKTTVQLTTIDKDTENLIKSAILLRYVNERKMQAEIRLSGRIDRSVLDEISAQLFDLLRRFSKPVERIAIADVEDYRTASGADITVMTLDIILKSDGKKTVDDLTSDSSAFRFQLLKKLDSTLPDEYQGLYGGAIPGPQTLPYVENETTTRRSDWWVHEYWYVILMVVLAFVILLVGAIIIPIALDRRRHRGIKIIDNGLAHTRV